MLKTSNIKKSFPSGFTLGPCQLHFYEGEAIAILGKNGAGKSTLFQLLTANLDPSSGEILFRGERLRPEHSEIRKHIGYLPQNMQLPSWVSGLELLSYAQSLNSSVIRKTRVEEWMHYWDCYDYRKTPLSICSYGMQKRIALALATLHEPACMILDEPFSGLDLFHVKALEDLITLRKREGKLSILSSHVIPFVSKLCDRVVLLHKGVPLELEGWSKVDEASRSSQIELQFFS
ncbi:MAG: ABC transporter ATP-binding protein [Oligoflexales bacterium]|nr:ABC transporter ATP-binding protein [Oligoflexales bacterium]